MDIKQWRLSANVQSNMNKINIVANIKVSDYKSATPHSQTVKSKPHRLIILRQPSKHYKNHFIKRSKIRKPTEKGKKPVSQSPQ